MKLHVLKSDLTKLVTAAIEAAEWLCESPEGSDQRERGDALLVALVPYLHLNCPAVDTSTYLFANGYEIYCYDNGLDHYAARATGTGELLRDKNGIPFFAGRAGAIRAAKAAPFGGARTEGGKS
jgi:hypothetical protein